MLISPIDLYCKVCEEKIIVDTKISGNQICISCSKYSVFYYPRSNDLDSETLISDNYKLIFFPDYKEASIIEQIHPGYKLISSIKMEELTHELALKWLEKLKKYVLFQ